MKIMTVLELKNTCLEQKTIFSLEYNILIGAVESHIYPLKLGAANCRARISLPESVFGIM